MTSFFEFSFLLISLIFSPVVFKVPPESVLGAPGHKHNETADSHSNAHVGQIVLNCLLQVEETLLNWPSVGERKLVEEESLCANTAAVVLILEEGYKLNSVLIDFVAFNLSVLLLDGF